MLTEQEVAQIWEERRMMVRKFYSPSDNDFKWSLKKGIKGTEAHSWDKDLPEFWPGYNEALKERLRIRPHVEHGYYPADLFLKRAPNETDQEREYGRANFKQTTLAHADDWNNTILRALDRNNYTISFNDKESDYWEYVSTGLEEFGSVQNYVESIVPGVKTLDAMGLIVVLPREIVTVSETPEDSEEEIQVIDPDIALEPVPYYVKCTDVWGFDYDEWYLFLSSEKSWVDSYKREKTGLVFLLIDDQNVWRIAQTGTKGDFEFEITKWFEHGAGEAPAIHLKGRAIEKDGEIRWQSPYLSAVEHFDQVLLDEDYLRKSKAKCAYPHKIVLGDDCEFVDRETGATCYHGKLIWLDRETGIEQRKPCPDCNGSGLKSRIGPLGEVHVRPGDRSTGQTEIANVSEALSFVAPTAEILSFLRKEIVDETDAGRAVMHLKSEQPIVGGDQATATEVGVGVKANQAFVKPIADQIIDIMEFIYSMIGKIREGADFEEPIITRPSQYDIRTDEELAEDFRINSPIMPPVVVDQMGWNILAAEFGHSPEAMEVYKVVCAADRLMWTNPQTIQSRLQQRLIEPWQVVLHDQAMSFYGDLNRTGKITGDIEKDKEALIALAKANTPKVEMPTAAELALKVAR